MSADGLSTESPAEDGLLDSDSEAQIAEKISARKVEILHNNLTTSMPANIICSFIVFFSSFFTTSNPWISTWFISSLVVTFFRLTLPYIYMPRITSTKIKAAIFIFGATLTAILWGLVASFLLPIDGSIQRMITIVTAAGITAGGIQTLQPSFIASSFSILCIMTPICAWALFQPSIAHQILAIALITYLIFMLLIAYRGDKTITQILKMQFKNLALAEELSRANTKLQDYALATENSEKMLRNILENAPIGMTLVSIDGRFVQTNHALEELLGYTQKELRQLKPKEIIHPEDLPAASEEKFRLMEGKQVSVQMEKRYVHKTGELIWVLTNTSLVRDARGEPQYFIVQILDISERKHYETQLIELNKRTELTLNELKQRDSEMSSIKKMNDMLQICQDSSEAYSVIAVTTKHLFPDCNGGFVVYDSVNSLMKTVEQWGEPPTLKHSFHLEDCWALRSGSPYSVDKTSGNLICQHFKTPPIGSYLCMPLISHLGVTGLLYLNSVSDANISENQKQLATTVSEIARLFLANIQLRESLQDISIHDGLTGLYNRRYLDDTLKREIQLAKRQSQPLCLAMLDVDYFKSYNDKNGHEAGDEVLRCIAQILKENFRSSDFACRFGGEEFVIILINTDLNAAMDKLRHISEKIRTTHLSFHGNPLPPITISAGLAEAPKQADTADELMQAVDEALYHAKNLGRDSIVVYEKKSK